MSGAISRERGRVGVRSIRKEGRQVLADDAVEHGVVGPARDIVGGQRQSGGGGGKEAGRSRLNPSLDLYRARFRSRAGRGGTARPGARCGACRGLLATRLSRV
jgi:hypothetical protein